MKKFLGLLLCLSIVLGMSGIQAAFAAEPQIVGFKLDAINYYVDLGGEQGIKAILTYSDGSEKQIIDIKMYESNRSLYTAEYLKNNNVQIVQQEIVFTPSDAKIAKIDSNGLISGLGEGSTDVIATCGTRTAAAVISVTRIKELEAAANVPADKIWVINFHKKVEDSSVTDKYIMVYDDKGQKVAAGINTCSDKRIAVITPPEAGYQRGRTYTLYMGGNIKYIGTPGGYMGNSYTMKFSITQ